MGLERKQKNNQIKEYFRPSCITAPHKNQTANPLCQTIDDVRRANEKKMKNEKSSPGKKTLGKSTKIRSGSSIDDRDPNCDFFFFCSSFSLLSRFSYAPLYFSFSTIRLPLCVHVCICVYTCAWKPGSPRRWGFFFLAFLIRRREAFEASAPAYIVLPSTHKI